MSSSKLSKTENENLLKDEKSKALLSVDSRALAQHKLQRRRADELKTQHGELNNIKHEVSELKDEISEIKDLLKQLLTK
jgi:erythromycin esterase-like protein